MRALESLVVRDAAAPLLTMRVVVRGLSAKGRPAARAFASPPKQKSAKRQRPTGRIFFADLAFARPPKIKTYPRVRNSRRMILPVVVSGKDSTKAISRGYSCADKRSRTKAEISDASASEAA